MTLSSFISLPPELIAHIMSYIPSTDLMVFLRQLPTPFYLFLSRYVITLYSTSEEMIDHLCLVLPNLQHSIGTIVTNLKETKKLLYRSPLNLRVICEDLVVNVDLDSLVEIFSFLSPSASVFVDVRGDTTENVISIDDGLLYVKNTLKYKRHLKCLSHLITRGVIVSDRNSDNRILSLSADVLEPRYPRFLYTLDIVLQHAWVNSNLRTIILDYDFSVVDNHCWPVWLNTDITPFSCVTEVDGAILPHCVHRLRLLFPSVKRVSIYGSDEDLLSLGKEYPTIVFFRSSREKKALRPCIIQESSF